MNTNKNKDINELFGGFFPADEAARVAEDIRRGDELLSKNPAPLPRAALLADIKTQMLLAHYRKRRAHRLHYVYGSMAMAASVAIVCGLAWFFMAGSGTSDLGMAMEPRSFVSINENINSVTAQLDQIQDSATVLTSADSDLASPAEYQADITNLESSIWKG
jgi:hypothetical protein